MTAHLHDHILEALDRLDDWDLPAAELPHVLADTATALAGRWRDDADLATAIHAALHG